MLKDFGIDIWLLYGSFVYGLEAALVAFSENEIEVLPIFASDDESAELLAFFETLTANPRGLLRSELRIFGPQHAFALGRLEFPIRISTELAPCCVTSDTGYPHLQFSRLQGLTPGDQANWLHLVRNVWPRLGI